MLKIAKLPYCGYGQVGRLRPLSQESERLTLAEWTGLLCAGGIAAAAIAFIPLQWRVPGHAILKAALPIVCGVALVPRRYSGSIVGLAAAGAVAVFLGFGVRGMQPAAVAGLLAFGPAIDLAMIGSPTAGWRLYLRFAVAGLLANLMSFGVRWGSAWFQLDGPGPHTMKQLGWAALLSFALCGVAAGLISAVICFRTKAKPHCWASP